MAGGSSESKKLKLQNEYKSADWETVFSLTSVQTLYPAFAVLQLGPDCNAHMSVPFTDRYRYRYRYRNFILRRIF